VEIPAGDGAPATLVESIATDDDIFGFLVVRPSEIGQFGQLILQGGRLVLALRLLIERSITEAEERAGRDLIQDALLLRRGGHTSMAVATRLGYNHDGPAVVMAVRNPSPRQTAGVEDPRRRVEREVRDEVRAHTSGLVGLIGEEIVVVVRPEAADGCSRRIFERLSKSSGTSGPGIGISDQHNSLGDLEAAYREALTAAAVSERISHKVVWFTDLGLYRLFFDAQHADRVEEYIDRWLEPLLRYDADHHTHLVETLACHLTGAGREEVAAKLSIHPSTLKDRLRRIREIFGVDFDDTESRFNIELALRLVQVTRDLRTIGQR
jgi:sugar diacid utilization regulator